MSAADVAPFAITSASEWGATVTITTSSPHGFAVGKQVQIAGVGVGGYNGTYTITSIIDATNFTYTDRTRGLAGSSGGTATSLSNSSQSEQMAQGFAVFTIVGGYDEYARTTLQAVLPQNRSLTLANTRISDVSIPLLLDLKRLRLQQLDVLGTDVSTAGFRELSGQARGRRLNGVQQAPRSEWQTGKPAQRRMLPNGD